MKTKKMILKYATCLTVLRSTVSDPVKPATVPGSNVDFLFGLDKRAAPIQPPPAAVKFYDPAPEPVAPPVEYQERGGNWIVNRWLAWG